MLEKIFSEVVLVPELMNHIFLFGFFVRQLWPVYFFFFKLEPYIFLEHCLYFRCMQNQTLVGCFFLDCNCSLTSMYIFSQYCWSFPKVCCFNDLVQAKPLNPSCVCPLRPFRSFKHIVFLFHCSELYTNGLVDSIKKKSFWHIDIVNKAHVRY